MMAGAAFMASIGGPVFIGYGLDGSTGTSLLIPEPSTPAAPATNDMVVAFMAAFSGNPPSGAFVSWAQPAGFTERLDQGASPSMGVATQAAYDAGADTWTASADNGSIFGAQLAFRTATYDTIGTVATRTGDGDLVIPGITSAGGVVVALVVVNVGGTTTATPSGFTSRLNTNGVSGTLAAFTKYVPVGATGDVTVTFSSMFDAEAAGVLVGLR